MMLNYRRGVFCLESAAAQCLLGTRQQHVFYITRSLIILSCIYDDVLILNISVYMYIHGCLSNKLTIYSSVLN